MREGGETMTTTSMATSESAPRQENTFQGFLKSESVMARLQDVASKYMQPREIVRLMLVAASRNPQIAQCTNESILRCLMDAAALGIRPGGLMGRGYIIPRWNSKIKALEASFDPGWRGLADIARRSGLVKKIEAHTVFEKDTFLVTQGTNPGLEHVPYDGDDRGDIVAAYAVAFLADGLTHFEVLRRIDLDKIMSSSSSKDKQGNMVGPWKEWPEEMARKSAVRRLCKHLGCDEEMATAIEASDRSDFAGAALQGVVAGAQDMPQSKALAQKAAERAAAMATDDVEPEPVRSEPSPETPGETGVG